LAASAIVRISADLGVAEAKTEKGRAKEGPIQPAPA
jgi:hypothetical protein